MTPFMLLWRNWLAHSTVNRKVESSSLSRSFFFAFIAQLGERQTEDLKVAGSIPAEGTFGPLV